MLHSLIFLLISLIFLLSSGFFLVKSLKKISVLLQISEYSAAFIIMALATSIPEFFVGISSALEGAPSISLGNIIGANIIDLTLLTGIFILLGRGIKFNKKQIGDDVYFMLFSIILLAGLFFVGSELSRTDGLFLLFLFGFNIYRAIRKREQFVDSKKKNESFQGLLRPVLVFIISLAILFASSKFVVDYSILLADELAIPSLFVGLFLISFATTMPEFIFGLQAVLLRRGVMSIGDQTGTVFTNICLILGVVAIISPIPFEASLFLIPLIFLLMIGALFTYFQKSSKEFTISEGLLLIFIYLIFVTATFFMGKATLS